jgi:hypothetical protein
MRICRFSLRLALLGAATFAFAASAGAQGYGTNDQVLTIGAADFHPIDSHQVFNFGADDYVYGAGNYVAPLRLPDGAEITLMCFYVNDTDSSVMDARIVGMKLPAGGQVAGRVLITGSDIEPIYNIGYATTCTNPMSFTVLSDADLDGMGSEHIAYFVETFNTATSGFGGLRIIWHRQVSPAPATATFNDVPTSNQFFQFIEALNAAGITGGCQVSPPLYCPNNPVTRGQMAVFLAKALGLYWPN